MSVSLGEDLSHLGYNKIPQTWGLKATGTVEAGKPEIEVWAWVSPGEGPLPGSGSAFLLYPHVVEWRGALWGCFCKNPNSSHDLSTSPSFHHLWGLGFEHELGGHTHSERDR